MNKSIELAGRYKWVGFGLIRGVQFSLFNSGKLFPMLLDQRIANDQFNTTSLIFIIVSCLLIALLFRDDRPQLRRVLSFAATAFILLGLFLLAFGFALSSLMHEYIFFIAGGLCGAGFSTLTVLWLASFVGSEDPRKATSIVLAFLFGSVLSLLFIVMPTEFGLVFACISIALACFMYNCPEQSLDIDIKERESALKGVSATLSFVAIPLVVACVMQVIFLASSQIAFLGSYGFKYSNIAISIAMLIASLALTLYIVLRGKQLETLNLTSVVVVLVGTSLLLLPFQIDQTGYDVFFTAIAQFCNTVSYINLVLIGVHAIYELKGKPITFFAITEGCFRLVGLLGIQISIRFLNQSFDDAQIMLFVIACLYILGAFLLFVVRRQGNAKGSPVVSSSITMMGVAKMSEAQKKELSTLAEAAFKKRCEDIAAEALLTPRELEVLTMLSKGQSVARIGKDLSISINTVKSYMKMVYAKLDVHSKQELLDLFYGS
ncbi:MAG: helix-turn-helix transcriptional regulator [Coriobacteriales bacterium]|jgi:DNA-binding CsgD family transcriptional regulator|nr:helix-turn-helix transcriptional regulator [Coriobacteriales bacterium]